MDLRVGLLGLFFASVFSVVFAAPWDIFREPVSGLWVIEPVVLWVLLFVSFGLLVIALLALQRKHSEKLSWVCAAFGLFFIKAFLLVLDIYYSPGNFMNNAIQSFFDLLILGSLFIGIFRK